MREKPRSHDTSGIARAKLMVRPGRTVRWSALGCGADIRLIAFITEPELFRKVLAHQKAIQFTPGSRTTRLARPPLLAC